MVKNTLYPNLLSKVRRIKGDLDIAFASAETILKDEDLEKSHGKVSGLKKRIADAIIHLRTALGE